MKRRNRRGCELPPLAVSGAARAGDADAVEQVLRYYEDYINRLCTRTVCDESGSPHACPANAKARNLDLRCSP
nr:helix-turn-helix domain-containing protein [uncultured Oscillibacter sp.]